MTVAAGIIGDAGMHAVLTTFNMTAQRSGAADLNGSHHSSLRKIQVARVSCAPRLAMAAEDISELELGPEHFGLGRIELAGRHREWGCEDQKHEAVGGTRQTHFTSLRGAVGKPEGTTLTKGSETIRVSETRSYINCQRTEWGFDGLAPANLPLSRQGGP